MNVKALGWCAVLFNSLAVLILEGNDWQLVSLGCAVYCLYVTLNMEEEK